MSAALFDSNVVIDFTVGIPAALDEVSRYDEPSISVVTWIEVMAGARAEDEVYVRKILGGFDLVALTPEIAERAASIRRERRLKLPDAMIWASAQVNGLVTRDSAFPADDPDVRNPYTL